MTYFSSKCKFEFFSGDVDGTEIIGFVRKPIFDRDCLGVFVRNVPQKNLTAFLGIGFIYSFVGRKQRFSRSLVRGGRSSEGAKYCRTIILNRLNANSHLREIK